MSVAPEARPKRWYDGLTGYHWLVLVVASLGWLFDTMDQWLYVLARQPAITELLGPKPRARMWRALRGLCR